MYVDGASKSGIGGRWCYDARLACFSARVKTVKEGLFGMANQKSQVQSFDTWECPVSKIKQPIVLKLLVSRIARLAQW